MACGWSGIAHGRGKVGERFAAAFDEMTIQVQGGRTHLLGELIDPSQVQGLLYYLWNLGIELISVNPLPVEAVSAGGANPTGRSR